jgi:phosphoribosylformylglycinamidine synthase I
MKFGVITFPGSNCDQDLIDTLAGLSRLDPSASVVHLWHKDHDLQGCDMVFLPGGFSYGDYLRSGAIARFSPLMREVVAHAQRGGYVVGICNGFQILTEAGLLPGALQRNVGTRFICDYVHLRAAARDTPFTRAVGDAVLRVPIAHADGCYTADADTLKAIEDGNQVVFRYVNAQGELDPAANPNGSANAIAGVMNSGRNVFGFMPHPERAADPALGNTDGLKVFEGLLERVLV